MRNLIYRVRYWLRLRRLRREFDRLHKERDLATAMQRSWLLYGMVYMTRDSYGRVKVWDPRKFIITVKDR